MSLQDATLFGPRQIGDVLFIHILPFSPSAQWRPTFLVTVHGSCPLARLRGGQVPFSASSSLGKLAKIEPKKVPDPVLRERIPFLRSPRWGSTLPREGTEG